MLTSKEFETIAGIEAKERDEFLNKILLPMGARGSAVASVRTASGFVAKTVKRLKQGSKVRKRSSSSKNVARLGNKASSTTKGVENYNEVLVSEVKSLLGRGPNSK